MRAAQIETTDRVKKEIVREWIKAAWEFCDERKDFLQFAHDTLSALDRQHKKDRVLAENVRLASYEAERVAPFDVKSVRIRAENTLLKKTTKPVQAEVAGDTKPTSKKTKNKKAKAVEEVATSKPQSFVAKLGQAAGEILSTAVEHHLINASEIVALRNGMKQRISAIRTERAADMNLG